MEQTSWSDSFISSFPLKGQTNCRPDAGRWSITSGCLSSLQTLGLLNINAANVAGTHHRGNRTWEYWWKLASGSAAGPKHSQTHLLSFWFCGKPLMVRVSKQAADIPCGLTDQSNINPSAGQFPNQLSHFLVNAMSTASIVNRLLMSVT